MNERSREGRFVLDGSYRIVEWDDAASALLGVSREEALGRSCGEVLSGALPEDAPCRVHCPVRHDLKRGRLQGSSTQRRPSGNGAMVRCQLTALPGGDSGAVGTLRLAPSAVGDDDSGQSGGDGLDALHALAAFANMATAIGTGSLTQRLDTALDRIRNVLGADATEAFLLEPSNGDVVLTGHSGSFRRVFEQQLRFAPHEGVPGRVAADPVPLILDHLQGDERYLRDQVVAAGFQAYACVPLPGGSGPIGTLAAAFRRPPTDLSRHAQFLAWSAPVVASAIQAALTEQLTDQLTARLPAARSLGNGALNVPGKQGVDGAIEEALGRLVAAVDADGADLVLHSGRTRDLPMEAVATVGTPLPGRCHALRGGAGEDCCALSSGSPQLLAGDSSFWPSACRKATQRGGVRTCLPIELGNDHSALLRVWRARRGTAPLTRGLVVAELSALAIERLIRSRLSQGSNGQNGMAHAANGAMRTPSSVHAAEVRCFGAFELRLDGARVASDAFRRRKAATLLKVLLLHGDRAVDREVLLEALWPGADPERKASQLHVVAHELRRVLSSVPQAQEGEDPPLVLQSVDGGYRLRVACDAQVDLHTFEQAREDATKAVQNGDSQGAREQAQRATALYRGALFDDDPYAEWCWQDRERLREACQELHALAARLAGEAGDWPSCTRHWREALRLDPLREDVRRGLIRSLWHEGKRDQALEQFRRFETLLQRELGVAPLPATLSLVERIRTQAHP